ncbi:MAG: hypothetical protein V1703_02630 [Candidatus Altiarchaeota archaeon]
MGEKITSLQAVEIARAFLDKQTFKEAYTFEPVSVTNYMDYWEVLFPRKKPMRPAYGAIKVDKDTGKAAWVPLR